MCLKLPIDPASLRRRKILSAKVKMRVKLETLLKKFFFLLNEIHKRKNSNNIDYLNTQPKFSALNGKNKYVTSTSFMGTSVSIS